MILAKVKLYILFNCKDFITKICIKTGNTIVHVWKVIISSNSDEESSGPSQRRSTGPSVMMETIKVCTQRLPLPDGVGIVHASPAAGHLRFA